MSTVDATTAVKLVPILMAEIERLKQQSSTPDATDATKASMPDATKTSTSPMITQSTDLWRQSRVSLLEEEKSLQQVKTKNVTTA
jgi:hypothetical protein